MLLLAGLFAAPAAFSQPYATIYVTDNCTGQYLKNFPISYTCLPYGTQNKTTNISSTGGNFYAGFLGYDNNFQSYTYSGHFFLTGGHTFTVAANSGDLQWWPSQDGSITRTLNVNVAQTSGDFALNGVKQSSATGLPPAIFRSGSTNPALTFTALPYGYFTQYSITVTKGTWSGTAFYAAGGSSTATTGYVSANAFPSSSLQTLFPTLGLSTYTGAIQVKVATRTCTGNERTLTQVFSLQNISAAADFKMYCQGSGCASTNGTDRRTTLPIPNATFSASPTIPGWQGALSVGIETATAATGASSYRITVIEVNPTTGAEIGSLLVDITSVSLNPINFNDPTNGFFINNYTTLSSTNRTFKVTVRANTSGFYAETISYFRIAAGSQYWKMRNPVSTRDFAITPNPVVGGIAKIIWTASENENSLAAIIVTNAMGQLVLKSELAQHEGSNESVLNLTNLPSGTFYYRFHSGSRIETGSLVKP